MVEYKDITEETLPLIRDLLCSRFGEKSYSALEHILKNPLRRVYAPAGCMGMKNGAAVCCKVSMLRKLYWRQESFLALVGGYFCKAEKGCPLSVLLEVQSRSEWDKYPCRMRFGNTCIYTTMRMNRQIGAHQGTISWSQMRYGIVRHAAFLYHLIRRKIFDRPYPPVKKSYREADENRVILDARGMKIRRLADIDRRLGSFWERYLENNRGLVAARDPETLDWLFGERVRRGTDVLLAAFREDDVIGFIILRPLTSPYRWNIMDMIALDNSPDIMDRLLRGAMAFLKRDTDAITLESSGFPDFIQPVLGKHLDHVRDIGHNRFEWITTDPEIAEMIEENGNAPTSWFYGPIDGDYCL